MPWCCWACAKLSLIHISALMADGTSEIEEIGHIERGYENIVEKLRGLGAEISKVERMPAALEQAL